MDNIARVPIYNVRGDEMKVSLTQEFLVDLDDYERISEKRWRIVRVGTSRYDIMSIENNPVFCKNEVLGTDKNVMFISGDIFDNTKSNLRVI